MEPQFLPQPSVPQGHLPQPPASSADRWRVAALTLVVVCVALAVGLVVALVSGGSDKASGTATGKDTIALACEQVRQLPDSGVNPRDRVASDRLGIASSLAFMASDQDASVRPVTTAIMNISAAFARNYTLNDAAGRAAISDAKKACRGR